VEAVEVASDTEVDRNTLPKTVFTEAKFLETWKAYAAFLTKTGNKSLASILTASKPTLDTFHIHYALPNSLMGDQLERLRPKLLKYLRETLNNFSIDLTVTIEVSEVKKIVYTPQEKYDKLVELNPDIAFLKNLFKLDL